MLFKFEVLVLIFKFKFFSLVASEDYVVIQEVAAKMKNLAMDIKDTVSATGSTVQVKQFAEALNGFEADIVDTFSDFDSDHIFDTVEELLDSLRPVVNELLSLNSNNIDDQNQMEEVELIRENINTAVRVVSRFVRDIQLIFNARNQNVPKVSDTHLVNLLEIQHRTRKARLNQFGGLGK